MKPLLAVNDRTADAYVSILNGATRTVFLIGDYAIKLPRLGAGWRPFLRGLCANGIEREWWRDTRDPRLCPVLFGIPGGWLLIMPCCHGVIVEAPGLEEFLERFCDGDDYRIPAEAKSDSFGYLGDRLVAVDYGN